MNLEWKIALAHNWKKNENDHAMTEPEIIRDKTGKELFRCVRIDEKTEVVETDGEEIFRIVEVDDEGWAEFKALEAQHRREYAASPQAVIDHEAWVNAPMPEECRWGSIPLEEQVALKSWPKVIPHPSQPPLSQLKDFSL